jgi:hypothetical protein
MSKLFLSISTRIFIKIALKPNFMRISSSKFVVNKRL